MTYDQIAKHEACHKFRVVYYDNCNTVTLECIAHAEVLAEADREEEYV